MARRQDSQLVDALKNEDGLNARFLHAVEENNAKTALRFLKLGANINARGRHNQSALIFAIRQNNTPMALTLLEAGASLDPQDQDGATALYHAAALQNIPITRELIARGADITIANRDNEKALDIALRSGNPALVELFEAPLKQLIARIPGAPVSPKQEGDEDTMLTWAARTGQVTIVRTMAQAGANCTAKNKSGQTPLDVARAAGQRDIVRILEACARENP